MLGKNTKMETIVIKKRRKHKHLSHTEKCQIYNLEQSGMYYMKELAELFDTTPKTIREAVKEIDNFKRYGTPNDM